MWENVVMFLKSVLGVGLLVAFLWGVRTWLNRRDRITNPRTGRGGSGDPRRYEDDRQE